MLKHALIFIFFALFITKITSENTTRRQLFTNIVSDTNNIPNNNPIIKNLDTHGFVIAWFTNNFDIRMQIYSGDGNNVGNNKIVYSEGQNNRLVTGTSSSNGNFIIGFADNSTYQMRVFLFNHLGTEINNIVYSDIYQLKWTSSATLNNGNYVMVYLETNRNKYKFVIALPDLTLVNSWTSPTSTRQKNRIFCAALLNGDFILVYDQQTTPGSFYDVCGAIYDSLGNNLVSEFVVNSITMNDQYNPHVASLTTGGFVVVFDSFYNNSMQVFARIFNSAYQSIGIEFAVNTIVNNASHYPKVMGMKTSGFFVIHTNNSGTRLIYGRKYDNDGNLTTSPEFLAFRYSTGSQRQPSISHIKDDIIISYNQGFRKFFHFLCESINFLKYFML